MAAVTCFAGTTWGSVYPVTTITESQTFDDPVSATVAGWTEFNSRIPPQNYGFSASDNTGGASGPGEAGGIFANTSIRTSYADRTLGSPGNSLDLNVPIEANGEFSIFESASPDLDLFLAHFNPNNTIPTADKLGIELFDNNNSATSLRFRAAVFYSNGGSDTGPLVVVPTNATSFRYVYQPNFSGNGLLTAEFFSPSGTHVSIATVTARTSLPFSVNAFGFDTIPRPAADGVSLFADNLTYTIPEPASVALVVASAMGIALLRRR